MKKTIAIFAAFALVAGFAATAMAADWSFYGSARMSTFSVTQDEDSINNGVTPDESDTDTTWDLQGNARIGGTVSSGDVGGGFEYGHSDEAGNVTLRKIYGTWNFGAGELLLGQTYTPTVHFYSNQVGNGDQDLLGIGQPYDGRRAMIQLKMGNFKIALVDPSATATFNNGAQIGAWNAEVARLAAAGQLPAGTVAADWLIPAATFDDTDVTFPKLELAYKYSSDMFFIEPYAGYQTFDVVDATDESESISAYLAGIGFGVTFGPAKLSADLYLAQNAGVYGLTAGPGGVLEGGNPAWTGTDFEDNDEWGGMFVANFTINDMLSAEGGLGYRKNEIDDFETAVMSWYVNLPITLADGVFITPEIGQFIYGDLEFDGDEVLKQGNDTYFGAKWQINF